MTRGAGGAQQEAASTSAGAARRRAGSASCCREERAGEREGKETSSSERPNGRLRGEKPIFFVASAVIALNKNMEFFITVYSPCHVYSCLHVFLWWEGLLSVM